jgi:hypothetical protein
MGGRHRVGRHRRRPPILRRALMVCSILMAMASLYVAATRTQVVSNPVPSPVTPVLNITTPTIQWLPSNTTSTTPTKVKKRARAPKSLSNKIEKDGGTGPSGEINSPPMPAQQAPRVIQTTPRPPPKTKITTAPVIQQQVLIDKTTSQRSATQPSTKPTTKPNPKPQSNITTTLRVVPSPIPAPKAKPPPKPPSKPPTISPKPPPQPRVTTNPKCGTIGLLSVPRAACNQILSLFPQIKSVLGIGSRSSNPTSCHPKGLAIDFIVGTDKALGDRVFAYVTAHRSQLGATPVVLWQVAEHFDHVHVSFEPCKG